MFEMRHLILRFRERQKEMGIKPTSNNPSSKVRTRTEREKQRIYWRLKKRESRANQNSQKKRRVREENLSYYHHLKESNLGLEQQRRRRYKIPSDKEQYADMVENILEKATPQKKEALAKRNIFANSPLSRKKLKLMDHSFHVIKKIVSGNKKVKQTIVHNLSFRKKYRLNRLLSK
jgi:hypothetical protein